MEGKGYPPNKYPGYGPGPCTHSYNFNVVLLSLIQDGAKKPRPLASGRSVKKVPRVLQGSVAARHVELFNVEFITNMMPGLRREIFENRLTEAKIRTRVRCMFLTHGGQ